MIGIVSKTLLISTLNRIIRKPEDLLKQISFLPSGLSDMVLYEQKWEEFLAIYLYGKGHVDHEDLVQMMSQEERESTLESQTFRAKCFSRYLTGSTLVPNSCITVCVKDISLISTLLTVNVQIRFEDRSKCSGTDAVRFNHDEGVSSMWNYI